MMTAGVRVPSGAIVPSAGEGSPTGAADGGAAPSEDGAFVAVATGGAVTDAGEDVAASGSAVGSGVAAAAAAGA